jgi:hypothetical protein
LGLTSKTVGFHSHIYLWITGELFFFFGLGTFLIGLVALQESTALLSAGVPSDSSLER